MPINCDESYKDELTSKTRARGFVRHGTAETLTQLTLGSEKFYSSLRRGRTDPLGPEPVSTPCGPGALAL